MRDIPETGKVVHYKPFFWWLIRARFPNVSWEFAIIPYGRRVHVKHHLTELNILYHESVHLKQQRHSYVYGLWWWFRYLTSQRFVAKQEREAYTKEWQWVKQNIKGREIRAQLKHQIAQRWSHQMYNNIITFNEALKELK